GRSGAPAEPRRPGIGRRAQGRRVVRTRTIGRRRRNPGGTRMDREEATVIANDAREQRGLSWANLAEVAGRSKVWTTSALLGQQAIPAEVAQKVGAALGLDADVVSALQRSPSKGCLGDMIPTDP